MNDLHDQRFMGIQMTQAWADLEKWERFFNEYPVGTFIELGTGNGGMTLFLAMQCRQRGIEFHTFDNQQFFNFNDGLPLLLELRRSFHFVDLFSQEAEDQIAGLFQRRHPIAIFFDNGNKAAEWKLFTPYTGTGDYCICHDWNREIGKRDIQGIGIERILGEEQKGPPKNMKELTAWFKRV